MSERYSIIGSSGELETYADPYGEVTDDMVVAAEKSEHEIIKRRNMVEQGFLEMAFLLDEFERSAYYTARGYPTFQAWTEDPAVEIGYRVAMDLLRITREAMPALQRHGYEFEDAVDLISDARVSKIRACLPLLSEGMEDEFVALIEQAPDMPLKDVNREVKMLRNPDDPDADLMDAVFKAEIRRGEKVSYYRVFVINGQRKEKVGELVIPNEHTARWNARFGDRWIEYELQEDG